MVIKSLKHGIITALLLFSWSAYAEKGLKECDDAGNLSEVKRVDRMIVQLNKMRKPLITEIDRASSSPQESCGRVKPEAERFLRLLGAVSKRMRELQPALKQLKEERCAQEFGEDIAATVMLQREITGKFNSACGSVAGQLSGGPVRGR
jgi:hypothetical protein